MADGDSVKMVTADNKRELFEAYDAAKAQIESSAKVLQESIVKIVESCGQGPFAWRGQEITMAKRGDGYVARVKARKAEEIV